MSQLHYDPTSFNTTGTIGKLSEEYYIDISEGSKSQYRILVYKRSLLLHYTTLVNKTAALNKCFRIYQENSKVGVELFLKALDIDLLEELESWKSREI